MLWYLDNYREKPQLNRIWNKKTKVNLKGNLCPSNHKNGTIWRETFNTEIQRLNEKPNFLLYLS